MVFKELEFEEEQDEEVGGRGGEEIFQNLIESILTVILLLV